MTDYSNRLKAVVKKQLWFERNNFAISNRVSETLNSSFSEIDRLLKLYEDNKISENSLKQMSFDIYQKNAKDLDDKLRSEAFTVVQSEKTMASRILVDSILFDSSKKTNVSVETNRILADDVISNNKFFTTEFTKYKRVTYERILTSVNDAIINKKTYEEAAKNMGEVEGFNKNQLKSLSRTMMRSVQTDTANIVYKRNGVKYVRLIAILDSNTTEVCRDLNGKIMLAEEAPKLPLHFNCRSNYLPVFEEELDQIKNEIITWNIFLQQHQDDKDLKRYRMYL